MVNIYDFNETDFNHRGFVLRNGIKFEVHEVVNGVYELNFEYPLDSEDSHLLEVDKILKVNNYDGTQLFRIKTLQKDLDTIKGYALHITYDLLGNFIEDIYIKGRNGAGALQEVLSKSVDPHRFEGISNINLLRNARLVRKNTLEAIMGDKDNSLLSRWGGELYRDNFRINWLTKIGSDKGVTVKYGKNLTGIEFTIDTTELVTHIMPKGFDGILLPEKYVESPIAYQYGSLKRRKVIEFEDIISKKKTPDNEGAVSHEQAMALLRERSKKAFENGIDKPKVTCTVAFVDLSQTEEYKHYQVLEKVYLGDTVGVKYKDIDLLTRCIAYTYDCLNDRYVTVELGEVPEQNLLMSTINFQDTLKTRVEEVELSITDKARGVLKESLTAGTGTKIRYYEDRILIMDTDDEATARVVWEWNADGLRVSTTGINGQFRSATSKDGHFFAEIITGLKINADMIEAGTIDFKHLNQNVYTKVREGLVTEEGLSTFVLNNEGFIQNIKKTITEKVAEETKDIKPPKRYVHKAFKGTDSLGRDFFTLNYKEGATEVGFTITNRAAKPTTSSAYQWLKLPQGATTLHLAFANSADGKLDCSYDSVGKTYVGYYIDNDPTDLPYPDRNTTLFTWIKLAGDEVEYTHFKYRVDLNSPILDNPTPETRYMGVAKTTSKTAPTDPSLYKWVSTAGKDSYFYTAYANSADGTKDFSTSNSVGKSYIGTLYSYLNTASENPADYKWFKAKGDDADAGKIFNLIDASEFYDLTCFKIYGTPDVKVLNKEFKGKNALEIKSPQTAVGAKDVSLLTSITQVKAGELFSLKFWFYLDSDISTDATARLSIFGNSFDLLNGTPKGTWVEKEFVGIQSKMNGKNILGLEVPKFSVNGKCRLLVCMPTLCYGGTPLVQWNNSLTDLKERYLNLDFKIDGSYSGGVATDVKYMLSIIYGGKRVGADADVYLKVRGAGINQEAFTSVIYNGSTVMTTLVPKGLVDGTPLDVTVQVKYRGLIANASARLTNLPDPKLIEDITTKYKTFESTLEKFESKIGESNRKTFKMFYRLDNLCTEIKVKMGNDLWFETKGLKSGKAYLVVADILYAPRKKFTRIYKSQNNTNQYIYSGINVWEVVYSEPQSQVNIYPLGAETVVNKVMVFEKPQTPFYGGNLVKSWSVTQDRGRLEYNLVDNLTIGATYCLEVDYAGDEYRELSLQTTTQVGGKELYQGYYPLIKSTEKIYFKIENSSQFDMYSKNVFLLKEPLKNITDIKGVRLYEVDFSRGSYLDYNITNLESKIEQTSEKIEHSVTKNNFGTILTQNAHHLRLAWNNISKYIQFEDAGMSFYEGGVVNQNKLTTRITDEGFQFWRDNKKIGFIGTQHLYREPTQHGLNFNLRNDGYYMGWAYEDVVGENPKLKWYYASKPDYNRGVKNDTLNAGCDVNLSGYNLHRACIDLDTCWFKGGAVTNTFRFALPASFSDDGTANRWTSECYMTFKHGILISSHLPTTT